MDVPRIRAALDDLNRLYPRCGIPALVLDGPFDLDNDWKGGQYPNADYPGVCFLLDASERLLRIGKASCRRCLGSRLGDYFEYSPDRTRGVAKDPQYADVRFIYTIRVPKDRAFEAAAIEEFLISRFEPSPPLNHIGRRPPD